MKLTKTQTPIKSGQAKQEDTFLSVHRNGNKKDEWVSHNKGYRCSDTCPEPEQPNLDNKNLIQGKDDKVVQECTCPAKELLDNIHSKWCALQQPKETKQEWICCKVDCENTAKHCIHHEQTFIAPASGIFRGQQPNAAGEKEWIRGLRELRRQAGYEPNAWYEKQEEKFIRNLLQEIINELMNISAMPAKNFTLKNLGKQSAINKKLFELRAKYSEGEVE